ncbi:hypothetical protein MARINOS108_11958 [Marinoscillum sp. 108]|nr:hypothetical protein MARINOS108_11958 [Marinoscillum sp. 108]
MLVISGLEVLQSRPDLINKNSFLNRGNVNFLRIAGSIVRFPSSCIKVCMENRGLAPVLRTFSSTV